MTLFLNFFPFLLWELWLGLLIIPCSQCISTRSLRIITPFLIKVSTTIAATTSRTCICFHWGIFSFTKSYRIFCISIFNSSPCSLKTISPVWITYYLFTSLSIGNLTNETKNEKIKYLLAMQNYNHIHGPCSGSWQHLCHLLSCP